MDPIDFLFYYPRQDCCKILTREDRERLSGTVEEVLEKNACTREPLLQHVNEAVSECNISQPAINAEE